MITKGAVISFAGAPNRATSGVSFWHPLRSLSEVELTITHSPGELIVTSRVRVRWGRAAATVVGLAALGLLTFVQPNGPPLRPLMFGLGALLVAGLIVRPLRVRSWLQQVLDREASLLRRTEQRKVLDGPDVGHLTTV